VVFLALVSLKLVGQAPNPTKVGFGFTSGSPGTNRHPEGRGVVFIEQLELSLVGMHRGLL